MEVIQNIFWDITEILTYNALFNFIVGERGTGKSFGLKQRAINNFLKKGTQFAYVRRFMSELEGKDIKNFFSDIQEFYPDVEFDVKEGKFFINDEVAGFMFSLTKAEKKKSMSFPGITLIIFDEFIIDNTNIGNRYLKNEVETFLSLYETIARMRDVKVFFLANAVSFVNPYFTYFNIEQPQNEKMIKKTSDILIQVVQNDPYRKAKLETRFGQLIQGTAFAEYAYENKALRDNSNFILKNGPKNKLMHFNLKMKKEIFGIWICQDDGFYWVSLKNDPTYPLTYTGITESHEVNTILLKGSSKSQRVKDFIKAYRDGNVRFESQYIKKSVLEIIKKA